MKNGGEKMKFKVGDRVKIIKDNSGESKYLGELATIEDIVDYDSEYPIRLKLDSMPYGTIDANQNEFKLYSSKKTVGIMASLSKLAKRTLDSDIKTLVKAGYLTNELEFTDEGDEALCALLLEQHKVQLVKMAKEDLKDRKEEREEKGC